MKKSEKETLKKAFNIPEPERKESFVSLYNQKLKKNERKFNLPVFFRYASTAVFAVLIIGLWGNLSKNADFRNKFTTVEEPSSAEAVLTTTVAQLTEENDITTAEIMTSQPVRTTAESSSVTVQTTQTTVIGKSSPPKTHAQVTMPDIPDFTPSVTALTFPTKPDTPTRTQPVYTSRVISATTTRKTTVVNKITTTKAKPTIDYNPEPSVVTTTSYYLPTPSTTKNEASAKPGQDVVTTLCTNENDAPPIVVPQPIETTTNPNDFTASDVKDYTVQPVKVYKKSDNIIDISDHECSAPNDNVVSVDMLTNESDYIVFGRIDDIIYTHVNGKPYTQENITVFQVYKGNKLMEYDKISIYIPGGYMPVSDYNSMNDNEISADDGDYIYSSGGNNGIQNIGDMCIFFLTNGSTYIPNGAFELTMHTDISIFRVRGSEYISLGNNSLSFPIKSLLNL